MDTIEKIRQHLKTIQDPKRFRHTLGTEELALLFAESFRLDADKTRTAALLHDVAKSMGHEEQIAYAAKNGIILSEHDLLAKGVIHAVVGSRIAEQEFGVTDPEILSAIRYHTTGRAGMTLFEKVIYAADYLDPSRGTRNERDLLALAKNDFEKGVFEIVRDKLSFYIRRGEHLHPLSVEFYCFQLDLLRKKV